jgi:hypothetical protein
MKFLGLIGTFLGSVVVCFFLLLGFAISRGKLDERGIKIGDIMPYIVVFSFLLATIVLISLPFDKRKKKGQKKKKK